MANLRRFAIFLYRIMILENEKDYISNGFSEGAKLKIRGFDKIREIWGDRDVEFHDSNIISLNMGENIIMRINVVGPLPDNSTVEDWQNSKWYQLVIVFEDIWEVDIKAQWLLIGGITFNGEASFFEHDSKNGLFFCSDNLGYILCSDIEIKEVKEC